MVTKLVQANTISTQFKKLLLTNILKFVSIDQL